MQKLTRDNVRRLVMHALFKPEEAPADGSNPPNAVCTDGIKSDFGFHPVRVHETRAELIEMIGELEPEFLQEDGFSFLFLGFHSAGGMWALDPATGVNDWSAMEGLFCLAQALGHARYTLDRPMWLALPGGAPFVRFSVVALPATLEA